MISVKGKFSKNGGYMNKKSFLYGLILFLTLVLTLGAVCASDEIAAEPLSLSVVEPSVNEVSYTSSYDVRSS